MFLVVVSGKPAWSQQDAEIWKSKPAPKETAVEKGDQKAAPQQVKRPKLAVTATVVDDISDELIEKFRLLTTSSDGRSAPVTWQSHTRKNVSDGLLKWGTDRPWETTLLRIDAEGYRPYVSRGIDREEGEVQLEIRLIPSKGIVGKVLTPDGKPAEGAQVAVCTMTNEVYVEKGRLRYGGHGRELAKLETTKADGSFQLPGEADTWVLVVAHESGYAEPTAEEFEKSPTVTLRPWARMEGEYLVGNKPVVGQPINANAGRGDVDVFLHYGEDTQTDAAGKFVIERVPPVRLYVQPLFKVAEKSRVRLWQFSGLIKFEPGKTTKVKLPRAGRTISGQIKPVAMGEIRLGDFEFDVSINLKPPKAVGFGAAGNQVFAAYNAFMKSDAGKEFHRSNVPVDAAGKFRIEDLPESQYTLYVKATQKPETVGAGTNPKQGFAARRVDVPPLEESAEDLSLGEIQLEWRDANSSK